MTADPELSSVFFHQLAAVEKKQVIEKVEEEKRFSLSTFFVFRLVP